MLAARFVGSASRALLPTDVEKHEALGIPAELLARAGVRRVDDRQARELLGINAKSGDFSEIEFPYVDPQTGHLVTSRIRLDRPPVKPDGSLDGKYRSRYGDNRHLYFPPGAGHALNDHSVPVVVVEAEKSALAITAAADRGGRRVLPVACGGCWGWSGRVGKAENASGARVDVKGPLSDLGRISWPGRTALVLFDARPDDSVRAARRKLARELRDRGAEVRHANLPDNDERVNGPDDLIATHGDSALWRIIDEARVEDFRLGPKGAILRDDLDNIRLALSRLGVDLRFDAFAQRVLVDGAGMDDITIDRLWVAIQDAFGFRPQKDTLRTVLDVEAHKARFHPVCDYLDRLAWDGVARLDEWLFTYAGAAPCDYVRAVGRLALIAAVRRVRRPGVKFDELLVLEGEQGGLKSSALRALCPNENWFSDDLPLGVDSKQIIERTSAKWLIEAAEMHGNRGREAEQLKAFLSRQVDGPVRLAYARSSVEVHRQFILIGTTNSQLSYLKDSTGSRRFWPVRVQRFDLEALCRDRDQLWAEAAAREACGESIRLAQDLWSAAGEQQEQRRAIDPWEDVLESVLDSDDDPIPVDAVWRTLGVQANHLDNRHADRVVAIFQRHGFTRTRVRIAGKPVRAWVRVPGCSEQRS